MGWWVFTGPARLASRAVPVEPSAARRYPIAKASAGVGEVAVPAQRRGPVLLRVVGAQPVQVQRDSSQRSSGWRCQYGGTTLAGSP